jgi:hypothetical protein
MQFLTDTHANRLAKYPANGFPAGSVFIETDRTVGYIDNGTAWAQPWGILIDPDAAGTLALLPSDLTTTDAGFLYKSAYYQRTWIWDGAAWHYLDSGVGAGGHVTRASSAPSGGLWTAANGAAVNCALDNATISSLTPLTVANTWMRR